MDNPMANEFISALQQLMCTKMMMQIGNYTNCETDGDNFLDFATATGAVTATSNELELLKVPINEVTNRSVDLPYDISFTYIAGYFCKNCLSKNDCEMCKMALLKVCFSIKPI